MFLSVVKISNKNKEKMEVGGKGDQINVLLLMSSWAWSIMADMNY